MAAVPPTPSIRPSAEARLILTDTCWSDYEAMLKIVGERRTRVTYDSGTMEVSTPSQRHEQVAQLLGLFVTRLAEELEVEYEPLGMTTWKLPAAAKGLKADQCYCIQHQAIAREKEALDLGIDPPPDLAIEVDITTNSLDRMEIYAGRRVPEVWRYDGRAVTVYQLQANAQYQPGDSTPSFPGARPADVTRFIELGRTTDKLRWARELREWVRRELISRGDSGQPSAEERA